MEICICIEWDLAELDIKVSATCNHVLIELELFFGLKLFLDNFVHWVLEVFSGEPFHETVDTAVILDKKLLGFVNTLLLEVVVLMVVYPLLALIAPSRPPPSEVHALPIWLALVVAHHQLRSQLPAHDLHEGDHLLARLAEGFILGEESKGVDEIEVIVFLEILVSVELDGVGEVALLEFQGSLFLDPMTLQVQQ